MCGLQLQKKFGDHPRSPSLRGESLDYTEKTSLFKEEIAKRLQSLMTIASRSLEIQEDFFPTLDLVLNKSL
jgi:hypothetical protein